ncbi:MAG: flagellar hook-basal body complex protein FliE [Gemmatimonadetes bacterium]|nr:flagellar hook-basal body complex protein FliE [Gemmatimonadota bacterium]
MSDMRIDGLGPARYTPLGRPAATPPPTNDFRDTLVSAMKEINGLQMQAGENVTRVTSGENVDLHEVMISSAEAGVAFDLMMEIRNKLLEAYQEVQRMQI